MSHFENALRNEWFTIMRSYSVSEESARMALESLKERYQEHHRAYHVWQHVWNVLEEIRPVEHTLVRPRETKLGVFYHDVIYNPRSSTNEAGNPLGS